MSATVSTNNDKNHGKATGSKNSQILEFLTSIESLPATEKALRLRQEFWQDQSVQIRDFGFPPEDVRHWGKSLPASMGGLEEPEDSETRGTKASGKVIALYDFEAENPTELSFKKGDELYIHYRQCEGWLVGYFKDESIGLIPENYVEFVNEEED